MTPEQRYSQNPFDLDLQPDEEGPWVRFSALAAAHAARLAAESDAGRLLADALTAATWKARAEAAEAALRAKDVEIARLRELVRSVLDACDEGRMVGGGVGGMTIEANIRGSVYNGVPAWPIEEARAELEDTP